MRIGSRSFDRVAIVVALASMVALGLGVYGVVHALRSSEEILPFSLAYSRTFGTQTTLSLLNRDGSIDQLTQSAGQDTGADWSPDGKRLVFVRDNDIYIQDEAGDHRLTARAGASSPHWSPDGQQIAYSSMQANTATIGFLWLMDANGANQHSVFSADGPNKLPQDCFGGFVGGWYPNGDRILYRGSFADGSISICSVKTDGTDVQTLIHDPTSGARDNSPTLSPDGATLAYVELRDGQTAIYVANADGSNPRKLVEDVGNQDFPAWSPDGLWMAFTSNFTGASKLYMAHPDGTGLTELSTQVAGASFPAWRPN